MARTDFASSARDGPQALTFASHRDLTGASRRDRWRNRRGQTQRGAGSQQAENSISTNAVILFKVILRLARFERLYQLNWLLKAAPRIFPLWRCSRVAAPDFNGEKSVNDAPKVFNDLMRWSSKAESLKLKTVSCNVSVCRKRALNNYCVCLCRLEHVPAHISPGNKPGKSGYCKARNGFHGAIMLFGLFQSVTEHHPHNTGEQMLIKV